MFYNIFRYFMHVVLVSKIAQALPVASPSKNIHTDEDLRRLSKSQEILQYMNVSVNPCDDFYEFSCGNYAKYNPTNPATQRVVISLQKAAESMNSKIKFILETDDAMAETEADRKVKLFYRSCLNTAENMEGYKSKLLNLLKEFGAMPVLEGDKWQESDFDWTKTVADIAYKTGLPIVFDISADNDFTNKSVRRIYFGHPEFLLEKKSLYVHNTTAHVRDMYRLSIATNLHNLLDIPADVASQTAQEILDFEISLAHGMIDYQLDQNLSEIFPLLDIGKVQQQYLPIWDSKELIGAALGFTPSKVYVERQYLQTALEVLKSTPRRQVANYIFYTFLSKFMVKKKNSLKEQRQYCFLLTKERFYKNLDNMIYRQYITEPMKEGIRTMWHEMKLTFDNMLQSARFDWMLADTRQHAVEKLKAMDLEILSYEANNFEEEFAQLNFTDQDYVHNIKEILSLRGQQARANISKSPQTSDNGAETSFTPTYAPQENSVKLPVSLLQSQDLYSPAYSPVFNYGSMAALIGHELMHGFDSNGRDFDASGNVRDWWDLQSSGEFIKRTQCFADQYKNYIFGGRPLPSTLSSQSENIADNGGVRLAYATYLQWHDKALKASQSMDLESLAGLEYTHKQLFFISYGQLWCSSFDPEYMAYLAAFDNHVSPKFRLIGSLSNLKEFSENFGCPVGSAMNPANKCEIY